MPLELKVAGRVYGGWQKTEVRYSLDELAGSFSVEHGVHWYGQDEASFVDELLPCELICEDGLLLKGWVDTTDLNSDATTATKGTFKGRSLVADLVDCSANHQGGTWRNQTLTQIAADLCRSYGLDLSRAVQDTEKFSKVTIQEGETAFDLLSRLARMRGLLWTSDERGRLVLTKAGLIRTSTVLQRGVNILSGSRSSSSRDRFKTYLVKGQVQGNDEIFGAKASQPKGQATDSEVLRERNLTIVADSGTSADMKRRATWERNVRAARARSATYRVQGWTNAEGLWRHNVLVTVKDPLFRMDGEYLIKAVKRIMDGSQGRVADLTVCDPAAFDVFREPKRPRKGAFL